MQYINLLEPRAVRAQLLADTKFFTCGCARCAAPLATSPDRFLEVCHRKKYRHNRSYNWAQRDGFRSPNASRCAAPLTTSCDPLTRF